MKTVGYNDGDLRKMLILSQKGDQVQYREFLKAILPIISSIAQRKVFNAEDSSDVIQEVLLSIHKALPTYDSKRAVLPWVVTITQRRIVDYIRKITRRNSTELLTEDGDVTFFQAETKLAIEGLKILDRLPADTKKAIILTKLEGYSTKEAAQMLGVKENALRTKVSRGMTKLRKKAEEGLFSE